MSKQEAMSLPSLQDPDPVKDVEGARLSDGGHVPIVSGVEIDEQRMKLRTGPTDEVRGALIVG